MTTESSEASKQFDVAKYQIKEEDKVYTLKVEDDEFDIKIKPITWQLKNEIIEQDSHRSLQLAKVDPFLADWIMA